MEQAGKKADLPPFKRLNGEKARVAYTQTDREGLCFGDFDVTTPVVKIILDGEVRTLSHERLRAASIRADITKHIENPVDFYQHAWIGTVYLDPVAHRDLLFAAAGNRPVSRARVMYDVSSRVYFIEDDLCRSTLLDADTPEALLGEPE